MKRVIAVMLAMLMLTGVALAQENSINNTMGTPDAQSAVIVTEAGREWTAPEYGDPLTLEGDLGFVINGVYYGVYSPVESLLSALGEPEEIISSPSCVFVGEDFEYDYAFGSLFTSPIDEKNIWYEFYVFDAGLVTTRGLAVGDSADRIIERYGANYYSEGDGMYTYSLSGDEQDYASPCIIFETAEDVIISIDIYYPTNVN